MFLWNIFFVNIFLLFCLHVFLIYHYMPVHYYTRKNSGVSLSPDDRTVRMITPDAIHRSQTYGSDADEPHSRFWVVYGPSPPAPVEAVRFLRTEIPEFFRVRLRYAWYRVLGLHCRHASPTNTTSQLS